MVICLLFPPWNHFRHAIFLSSSMPGTGICKHRKICGISTKTKKLNSSKGKKYETKVVGIGSSFCSNFFSWNPKKLRSRAKKMHFWNKWSKSRFLGHRILNAVTWPISNNFCFILFSLRLISFFGLGADAAYFFMFTYTCSRHARA